MPLCVYIHSLWVWNVVRFASECHQTGGIALKEAGAS